MEQILGTKKLLQMVSMISYPVQGAFPDYELQEKYFDIGLIDVPLYVHQYVWVKNTVAIS